MHIYSLRRFLSIFSQLDGFRKTKETEKGNLTSGNTGEIHRPYEKKPIAQWTAKNKELFID